nr:hypothetical protein [Tanacetum cinerariifolium]
MRKLLIRLLSLSLSPSPIPVEDSDSLMDEIDLFLATDDLLPPGIKNDDYDSEGDIYFLEELLVDDSISLPKNELSNFDHHDDSLFPCPPLEPLDVESFFDLKPNSGEVISAMMNNIDELNEDECFDLGGEIDVFTNVEDDDYFPFIFVIQIFLPYLIYPWVSPLLLSTGRCALLRKKFKEDLFTYCIENEILQNYSEPSNDNTNVVNAPREPFVGNQDPGKNSSQSPLLINHHCCNGCGDPLGGIFCHQCTCELYGNDAHYGYNCPSKVSIIPDPEPFNNQTIKELPPTVQSFDPKSDLVYDSHNVFDPPPQLPFYSCEFCGNDARYGHYCTPQVPFIYPEPCYNQDFNFSKDSHDFQQQYLCCENCGEEEKQIKEEQAARYWKIPACYDDDDDDYTFAFTPNEPDNSPIMGDEHFDTIPAMKSDEFIKSSVENLVPNPSEPEGEHECDVPVCEDFITFLNILFDADYDFYSVDDQSLFDEDVPKKIFLNPLFDEEIISMKIEPNHFNAESDLIESLLNHDSSIISSSKIDSLSDEFAGELTLLKSIPPGINETDCDPEEETHFIKRFLYDNSSPRPPKEFISENSNTKIESFSPSPIPVEDSDSLIEEIDLSFNLDYPMSPGIEEDDYDSERDILILKNCSAIIPIHFLKMSHFILIFPRPLVLLQNHQMEKSLDLLSHLGHEAFQPSAECLMRIYGKNTPILDVPCFHFYPP